MSAGPLMGLKKIPGGTPSGNLGVSAPVEVEDGALRVSERGAAKNFTLLMLDEIRALRIGFEKWLDLPDGELLALSKRENDGD